MTLDYWNERAHALVGRKIVESRYMTDEEQKSYGWERKAIVLVLDDGEYIVPSADDEGNDAGALFHGANAAFPVI